MHIFKLPTAEARGVARDSTSHLPPVFGVSLPHLSILLVPTSHLRGGVVWVQPSISHQFWGPTSHLPPVFWASLRHPTLLWPTSHLQFTMRVWHGSQPPISHMFCGSPSHLPPVFGANSHIPPVLGATLSPPISCHATHYSDNHY